jgi:hypothetical protein
VRDPSKDIGLPTEGANRRSGNSVFSYLFAKNGESAILQDGHVTKRRLFESKVSRGRFTVIRALV